MDYSCSTALFKRDIIIRVPLWEVTLWLQGESKQAFTAEVLLVSPNDGLNVADCLLHYRQSRKELFQLVLKMSEFNQNIAEYLICTSYLVLC